MALNVSGYVDPGVYVGEVVVPGSISLTSERVLCIVALAPRTRRTSDEAVIRGKVFEETLSTWTSTTGGYEIELSNVSNRDRTNAILYKNSNAVALGNWSFKPAYVRGKAVAGAAIDYSAATGTIADYLTVSLDGKPAVTIDVSGAVDASVTVTSIAANINSALNLDANYGAAYAAVAGTVATSAPADTLTITSPISTSSSSIRLFFSHEDLAGTHEDGSSLLFGAGVEIGMVAAPTSGAAVEAPTIVKLLTAEYSSSATYEIEYVTIETQTDPLTNATTDTPLDSIISVGSFPGASNYIINTDYEESGNLIDWELATTAQATFTGLDDGSGTFDTSVNTDIKFSINDKDPITVTLTSGAATNVATIVDDINDALNSSSEYGPEYAHVASASASGTAITLTVPSSLESFTPFRGSASFITFYTEDAMAAIFNLSSSTLTTPYSVYGVGARPSFGTVYYATYNYDRDTTEYDIPTRVYNSSDLYSFTSPLTATNYTTNNMAVAGALAFENGASSMFLQLINDSTATGTPTTSQIKTAIDNCAKKSDITDVVVIDARSDEDEISAYLMNHISTQSSFLNKNYRRGWYGMVRDTDVGDPDTPDTFVFRATRTLNPGSTSPGRGRQILCAPSNISRTITLDDSSEVDLDLDSTYAACAVAGLFVSLPSVSDSLIRRQIVGFNTSDFEEFTKAERGTLAGNGVLVATLDAGVIRLLDPITTEAGGGGIVHFEEPQGSAMKDSVTRAVETVLNNNVVGVVPSDLTDFISDIKTWIASAIRSKINDGSIGPYKDNNNTVRDINLVSDVQVAQSSTDPRSFTFRYWYNLKYPGKRFFGEYSVDNPFFSA